VPNAWATCCSGVTVTVGLFLSVLVPSWPGGCVVQDQPGDLGGDAGREEPVPHPSPDTSSKRAHGMSAARAWPFAGGSSGSSVPWMTRVEAVMAESGACRAFTPGTLSPHLPSAKKAQSPSPCARSETPENPIGAWATS